MTRRIFYIFTAILLSVAVFSCRDDKFELAGIEDGEIDVNATVTFSPITDALSGSRTAGDAVKRINSLAVIIYNQDNEYVSHVMVDEADINQTGNTETPDDAVGDGEHKSETSTPEASFRIAGLKSGRYHIYAVANMGDIVNNYDVTTVDKLKSISLRWNSGNIAANNQMFGYFTLASQTASKGFDAPLITINRVNNNIHAWVKRVVSKVTVAIDGSGLYNGVQVWIKSIQIKDIPNQCYLGRDNVAYTNSLISNGERFEISSLEGAAGPSVTKDSPLCYYGMSSDDKSLDAAHSETSPALYFFENMQGKGQSKKQVWPGQEDKTKPMFPNGNNPLDKGFKDSKRDGTYIEVIGYYKGFLSEDDGSLAETEGPIIYRFMLGKDADTDYDAQRNYHYKLTMKLQGNANDADWHIVYQPETDIIVPNPYYISYLYDQSMTLPVKVLGKRLISLRADIIENGWHAINVSENENPYPYYTGTLDNPGPWNGFLSLRKTQTARFGVWPKPNDLKDPLNPENNSGKFGPGQSLTYTQNKTYYENNNRGWRVYNVTPGDHIDDVNGNYSVSTNGAGEWTVAVPLYTRAAVMVSQTGYTGNNPYVAYRREAKVKFTAVIEGYDGKEHTVICGTEPTATREPVTIYQMRRVVNPKGIWRKHDSVEPFHVKMMIQEGESATSFSELYSDGPWLAVIKTGDWFDIEATEGRSQKNPDGTISGIGDMYEDGNVGRIVDFTFRPKTTTSEPRCGIIKIFYNNYSCVHLIFVRQGYDPISFPSSNVKWHSFNLKSANEEVKDPVLEGSYFRRYNTALPVDASNNKSDMYSLDNGVVVWQNNKSFDFKIAGQNPTKKWADIKTTRTSWDTNAFVIGEKQCRLATEKDVAEVVSAANTIYGYGVLYSDGTSETQSSVSNVYGAREGDTTNKGMRGVFVCDSVVGTQIFLPIGVTGYGRFKQLANGKYNRQANGYSGVNQYANRYQPMGTDGYGVQYKPLFWDLYRRPGALYWLSGNNILDINYYTFSFDLTTSADVGVVWSSDPDPSGSDAILLRLVEDVPN